MKGVAGRTIFTRQRDVTLRKYIDDLKLFKSKITHVDYTQHFIDVRYYLRTTSEQGYVFTFTYMWEDCDKSMKNYIYLHSGYVVSENNKVLTLSTEDILRFVNYTQLDSVEDDIEIQTKLSTFTESVLDHDDEVKTLIHKIDSSFFDIAK